MSDTLSGQFLVAGKHLRDPNFYRTVVLMVEHGHEGAMGLVVNRPTPVTLGEALSAHFEVRDGEASVYYGGPVEPAALFVAHNQGEAGESAVVPGVHVGSSAEAFERVVTADAPSPDDLRFRVFSGCAGWGPGQLEGELDRGDWFVVPATSERTFEADPYELWESMLREVGDRTLGTSRPPVDPEWN